MARSIETVTVRMVIPRWVLPAMWLLFYAMYPVLMLANDAQREAFIDWLAAWISRRVRIEPV